MVARYDCAHSAALGSRGKAHTGSLSFAPTEEPREYFRHAIHFDSASLEAQDYWKAIEVAHASRPDLLQRLVEVCSRHNISLEELSATAAETEALTMVQVVSSALSRERLARKLHETASLVVAGFMQDAG